MSPVIRIASLPLSLVIISNSLPDTRCTAIDRLDVPLVVRNGTGPVDLTCVYTIDPKNHDTDFAVKWFLNWRQIYLWMPLAVSPIVESIIDKFGEFPAQYLNRPYTHSIIRLNTVTLDMSGRYACRVITIANQVTEVAKMVVYEPENNVSISNSDSNGTHVNFSCIVTGAQPRPKLTFYVEGIEVEDGYDEFTNAAEYKRNPWTTRRMVVRDLPYPAVIECEISIPDTDYKRREKVVYYPNTSRPNAIEIATL